MTAAQIPRPPLRHRARRHDGARRGRHGPRDQLRRSAHHRHRHGPGREIEHFCGLAGRVIAQTRRRVLHGEQIRRGLITDTGSSRTVSGEASGLRKPRRSWSRGSSARSSRPVLSLAPWQRTWRTASAALREERDDRGDDGDAALTGIRFLGDGSAIFARKRKP